MSVAVANTKATEVAERMLEATEICRWHEGSRATIYFDVDGRRLLAGGRGFGKLARGPVDMGLSMKAAFIVEYPFSPSLASFSDMAAEHLLTGARVIYDEERWEDDHRVDDQARAFGEDIAEDWQLERRLNEIERKEAA